MLNLKWPLKTQLLYRRSLRLSLMSVGFIVAGSLMVSCGQAGFGIFGGKKNKDSEPVAEQNPSATPVNPQTIVQVPGGQGNTQPPPMSPVPGTTVPANPMAPTAALEIIYNGYPSLNIPLGVVVSVRPTLDTVDPDDLGKVTCNNPGIVKVDYDFGDGLKSSVARSSVDDCKALATDYVFTKSGMYTVKILVTSNEGETAEASTSVYVGTISGNQGGFSIRGNPLIVRQGQNVSFEANCRTAVGTKKVSWNFPDQKTLEGVTTSRSFDQVGVFPVTAQCQESGGTVRTASIRVFVYQTGYIWPQQTAPNILPVIPGFSSPSQIPAQSVCDSLGNGNPGVVVDPFDPNLQGPWQCPNPRYLP